MIVMVNAYVQRSDKGDIVLSFRHHAISHVLLLSGVRSINLLKCETCETCLRYSRSTIRVSTVSVTN